MELLGTCKVENVWKWIQKIRAELNRHIDRMKNDIVIKMCEDYKPEDRKIVGRLRKR